jgi:hypothetical protein
MFRHLDSLVWVARLRRTIPYLLIVFVIATFMRRYNEPLTPDLLWSNISVNLLILLIVISSVPYVMYPIEQSYSVTLSRRSRVWLGVGAVVVSIGLQWVLWQRWSGYGVVAAWVVGIVGALVSDLDPVVPADIQIAPRWRTMPYWVGIYGASLLTLMLLPTITPLLLVLVPLLTLWVPGIALARVLLPNEPSMLLRIASAPALAIGAQLIVLMWLHLFGVPLGRWTFLLVSAAITLISEAIALLMPRSDAP